MAKVPQNSQLRRLDSYTHATIYSCDSPILELNFFHHVVAAPWLRPPQIRISPGHLERDSQLLGLKPEYRRPLAAQASLLQRIDLSLPTLRGKGAVPPLQ